MIFEILHFQDTEFHIPVGKYANTNQNSYFKLDFPKKKLLML